MSRNKRIIRIGLTLMLWANVGLLLHGVLPHHHHHEQIVFFSMGCGHEGCSHVEAYVRHIHCLCETETETEPSSHGYHKCVIGDIYNEQNSKKENPESSFFVGDHLPVATLFLSSEVNMEFLGIEEGIPVDFPEYVESLHSSLLARSSVLRGPPVA